MNDNNYITSSIQIAKNSIYLYLQQIMSLAISIITIRITISILGVSDYGINSVVTGTVAMFQFIVGSLSVGTQRFFSYHIGKRDMDGLKRTFRMTFTIYFVMALVIVLLTEIVGIWFLENKLVIPVERMFAARCVFHISILSLFVSLLQAPFSASIIAHENMKIFAQMGLYDVTMKLVIVYLLVISPFDKLISLCVMTFLVSLSSIVFYQWYTRKHYEECISKFIWDKRLAKELLSFNGWNLFGQFAWMMKNQGLGILLNMYFGPVVNASQQIGVQIRGICVGFTQNIGVSVNPQIVKSYAAGDINHMKSLVFRTARITFIIMLTLTLPILFHLDYVLEIWLIEVPLYAVMITKLLLIENLCEISSLPLATVNQATGKIALYQAIIGVLGLLCVPISYVGLKLGFVPENVFEVGILSQVMISIVRILFSKKVLCVEYKEMIKEVYAPTFSAAFISFVFCYIFYSKSSTFIMNALLIVLEVVMTIIISFFIAMKRDDKAIIKKIIVSKITRSDKVL